MSEPNNDRQHLVDHTKLESDIATGPMRIPFATFPADRISDDKTVADAIWNATAAMREKCAQAAESIYLLGYNHPDDIKKAIAVKIRSLK